MAFMFGKKIGVVKSAETEIKETQDMETIMKIAELKGMLQDAIDKGEPYKIIDVDRKFFFIDPDIQTPERTERSYDYLINNWDERKCLPLIGIPHFETGVISIADGGGRIIAAHVVDPKKYQKMKVMVILNFPTDLEERKIFEATLFVTQNDQVATLTPIQKHGARVTMKDPAALAIEVMRERYGIEISTVKGNRKENVIGSYNQVYKIGKRHGVTGLDWMFDLCKKAGFDRKPNGYAKYIIKALSDIYELYPEEREESKDILSDYLREWNPSTFKASAVAKYKMLYETTATSLYLEDVYIMLTGKDRRRELDGTKVRTKTRKKTA